MNATPFTGLGRRRYDRASDGYNAFELPLVPRFRGQSKTEKLREALRSNARLTALQLATLADLDNSGLVGALLKHDIALGRVKFEDGGYYWNHEFDERVRQAIEDAIVVLRRHGYTVQAPK